MSSNWYFAKSGVSNGPVSLEDLRRDLQSGVLGPETLVWNPSIPNWRPASEMAELRVSPPPLPTGQTQGTFDSAPIALAEPRRDPAPSAPWSPHGPQTTNATQSHSQIGPDGLYIGAPSRGFGEAISTCFNKYVTFSGRASRSEYWYFYLFIWLVNTATSFFDTIGKIGSSEFQRESAGLTPLLFSLAFFLPSISALVRRLHDTGRSGWWIGAPIIGLFATITVVAALTSGFTAIEGPVAVLVSISIFGFFIWWIALLVFTCQKGTPGPNRFG